VVHRAERGPPARQAPCRWSTEQSGVHQQERLLAGDPQGGVHGGQLLVQVRGEWAGDPLRLELERSGERADVLRGQRVILYGRQGWIAQPVPGADVSPPVLGGRASQLGEHLGVLGQDAGRQIRPRGEVAEAGRGPDQRSTGNVGVAGRLDPGLHRQLFGGLDQLPGRQLRRRPELVIEVAFDGREHLGPLRQRVGSLVGLAGAGLEVTDLARRLGVRRQRHRPGREHGAVVAASTLATLQSGDDLELGGGQGDLPPRGRRHPGRGSWSVRRPRTRRVPGHVRGLRHLRRGDHPLRLHQPGRDITSTGQGPGNRPAQVADRPPAPPCSGRRGRDPGVRRDQLLGDGHRLPDQRHDQQDAADQHHRGQQPHNRDKPRTDAARATTPGRKPRLHRWSSLGWREQGSSPAGVREPARWLGPGAAPPGDRAAAPATPWTLPADRPRTGHARATRPPRSKPCGDPYLTSSTGSTGTAIVATPAHPRDGPNSRSWLKRDSWRVRAAAGRVAPLPGVTWLARLPPRRWPGQRPSARTWCRPPPEGA